MAQNAGKNILPASTGVDDDIVGRILSRHMEEVPSDATVKLVHGALLKDIISAADFIELSAGAQIVFV